MMFLKLLGKVAVIAILIQFFSAAHASDVCPADIIEKLSRAWEIKADSEIRASACKKWPGEERRMLVALSYAPLGHVEYEDDLPLHVGIVQLPQVKVLNHFQSKILEDATWNVSEFYFTLDTSRYFLADGVRAFALRESGFREPGAADGGAEDQFTLFVLGKNKDIRPILFVPHMKFWRYELDSNYVRTKTIVAKLTVSVEKTFSNGFADLLITAREEDSSRVIFTLLLNYDGTIYRNEKLIQRINKWREL